MNALTVVAPLLYFLLAASVQSAPISSPPAPSQAFREAAARAKVLVEKILKDIPAVHTSIISTEGLTLDPSSQTTNLQVMMMELGIPTAPVLKPLSERFTLDMCVSRMLEGGRLYQELLGVLTSKLGGLEGVRADLRDLLTHINKMKEAAQLSGDSSDRSGLDLSSRLHGNYEIQVAAHLTLTQLRSFCYELIRSLRAIATHRPVAAGTH